MQIIAAYLKAVKRIAWAAVLLNYEILDVGAESGLHDSFPPQIAVSDLSNYCVRAVFFCHVFEMKYFNAPCKFVDPVANVCACILKPACIKNKVNILRIEFVYKAVHRKSSVRKLDKFLAVVVVAERKTMRRYCACNLIYACDKCFISLEQCFPPTAIPMISVPRSLCFCR